MKHKFVDFTKAKRDFGEKLILQFIGFAQSHVTLHTHNQHLISLYSNIWNSYKISHFSSQNIVTFNVIWKAEMNKIWIQNIIIIKKEIHINLQNFYKIQTGPRLVKIFCKNKLSQKCLSVTKQWFCIKIFLTSSNSRDI